MILLAKYCGKLKWSFLQSTSEHWELVRNLKKKANFLWRGGQSLLQEKLTVFLHPNYNAMEDRLQDLKKWRKIKLESNRHVKAKPVSTERRWKICWNCCRINCNKFEESHGSELCSCAACGPAILNLSDHTVGPRPTVWFSCSAPMSEDVRHGFSCVCSPAVGVCPTLFLM